MSWGWDQLLDELSRTDTNVQETAVWEFIFFFYENLIFFNENLICYKSKGWAAEREGSRSQPDDGKCFGWWFFPVWHSADCGGAVAQAKSMARFLARMGGCGSWVSMDLGVGARRSCCWRPGGSLGADLKLRAARGILEQTFPAFRCNLLDWACCC